MAGRLLAAALMLACAPALGQDVRPTNLVVDQTGYWHQYCRFGPDRVSPDLLASEGEKLLGAALLQRVRKAAEEGLKKSGVEPGSVDWKQHVYVRMFFDQYPPCVGLLPGQDWMKPQFDDASWVFQRGILLEPEKGRVVPRGLGWTSEDLDQAAFSCLGIQSCYYRSRFVVDDPANVADLRLSCRYRGGLRAFVNGQEVARGHLPADATPDAAATEYPLGVYLDQPALRDRSVGPVTVPSRLLQKGVNVLAIEVRSPRLHPVVLKMNLPRNNHKVRQGMEGLWCHADLMRVALTTSSPAIRSAQKRPPGVQAWVQDMHHRTESTEFLPADEPPGEVRFVGPRNGCFSGQVLVGTDKPLTDLSVQCSDLTASGPGGGIPASAIQVSFLAPFPADEFTTQKLGDDRGLGATFPDADRLANWEGSQDASRLCIFDHVSSQPRPIIPAGTCQPVWLTLRIPADARPGAYQGQVEIEGKDLKPIRLPVRAKVLDWTLPHPKDFRTFVACEQNPYGVAKQYGLALWSEAHRKALAASFRQLARVGNAWLNVPVIARTEFGNRDDALIRWTRRRDGQFTFDYSLLDAYPDLACDHCRRPGVVNFVVMQGMKSSAQPAEVPSVHVLDEASGRKQVLSLDGIAREEKERLWRAFATSLCEHMQARKLDQAACWGYPLEQEADPELKTLLEKIVPSARWAANPHEMFWNATYAKDGHYGVITTVRHQYVTPGLRLDRGWRSDLAHLLSPRTGGNVLAMHTTSYPFAYRVLPSRALATGHSGIGRIGADEWAAIHYDGMGPTAWLTGMPVLFVLWPGKQGAESSARFEALIEGIQEAETRIFLEQAIDGKRLPPEMTRRATEVLAAQQQETSFLGGTLWVHELERYHWGWQERSARLYRIAGEVAAALAARP
jgi:hypothetical protein